MNLPAASNAMAFRAGLFSGVIFAATSVLKFLSIGPSLHTPVYLVGFIAPVIAFVVGDELSLPHVPYGINQESRISRIGTRFIYWIGGVLALEVPLIMLAVLVISLYK